MRKSILCAGILLLPTLAPSQVLIDDFESGKMWTPFRGVLSKDFPEYRIETEDNNKFLRAEPKKGATGKAIYKQFSINLKKTPRLKWRWRVRELPPGGTEGIAAKNDSAAAVYVYMQKGLIRKIIKYCFSTTRKEGEWIPALSSNWLWKTKMKILRSGKPLNEWVEEVVDIRKDFKEAYGDDPPNHSDGIGVLTDGDQTSSTPKADYDDFYLLPPEETTLLK